MHRRRVPRPQWSSLGDSAHFDMAQASELKGDTVAGRSLPDAGAGGTVPSAGAARAARKRRAGHKRRRSVQLGRLAADPAQLTCLTAEEQQRRAVANYRAITADITAIGASLADRSFATRVPDEN